MDEPEDAPLLQLVRDQQERVDERRDGRPVGDRQPRQQSAEPPKHRERFRAVDGKIASYRVTVAQICTRAMQGSSIYKLNNLWSQWAA